MAEQMAEDPVFRMRSTFERTTVADGAEALLVDTWIDPKGGVSAHVHPAMEERFEVIEGRPDFLTGFRWRTYAPGDVAVVPPGTRHAFRNRNPEVAHIRCTATPPSSLQAFLEDAAALSRAGQINRFALPTSLDGLLQAAVMVEAYRDMAELGAPLPPQFVQRLIFPPLARLGARRGYRAGTFAQARPAT